jgi:tRNA dimethylallyltransferase
MNKIKVVAIVGPTASGKSVIAIDLSRRFDGEIVSADSMQIYRYLDIGTAKTVKEAKENIRHHLIDIADPDEEFTAARYRDEASKVIREIHERGKNVFVVGGTGLYIRALTKGLFKGPGSDAQLRSELAMLGSGNDGARYLYEKLKETDPEAALRIHPNNTARIIRALEVYYLTKKSISVFQKEHNFSEEPYELIKIGLSVDRKSLYKSIEDRVDNMMKVGLEEEARRLLDMGYSPGLKTMRGLGYKEIIGYIQNKYSREDAVREIKKNTRRYAKRQMTWFKKEADIRWFASEEKDKIISLIEGFLNES